MTITGVPWYIWKRRAWGTFRNKPQMCFKKLVSGKCSKRFFRIESVMLVCPALLTSTNKDVFYSKCLMLDLSNGSKANDISLATTMCTLRCGGSVSYSLWRLFLHHSELLHFCQKLAAIYRAKGVLLTYISTWPSASCDRHVATLFQLGGIVCFILSAVRKTFYSITAHWRRPCLH